VGANSSTSFADARAWFDALVGRDLHLIIYVAEMPIVELDGRLDQAVAQDRSGLAESGRIPRPPESGEVFAYQVGSGVFALAEELLVSAEHVGSSLALDLLDGVEVVAHPWRAE
jgi:hypothetical protein